jgi:hypothetical protein
MKAENGIHLNHHWRGPKLTTITNKQGTSEKRIEYYLDVYIPIPMSLFDRMDTRAFDIDAKAWVSVADRSPKQLTKLERLPFSLLSRIPGQDDAVAMVL